MLFPRIVDSFSDLRQTANQSEEGNGELVYARDSSSLWIFLETRWVNIFSSELQGAIDDNTLRLERLELAGTSTPGETSGDVVTGLEHAFVLTSTTNPAIKIFNYGNNNLYYDVFNGTELLGSGEVDHNSTSIFHPNTLASLRIEFRLHPNTPLLEGGHIVVETAGG